MEFHSPTEVETPFGNRRLQTLGFSRLFECQRCFRDFSTCFLAGKKPQNFVFFCFALILKGLYNIARLSRGWGPPSGLERGGWELLPVCGGEIGPPNRTPYRRGGSVAVEGAKQRLSPPTMRHNGITYPNNFHLNYFWDYRFPIWVF